MLMLQSFVIWAIWFGLGHPRQCVGLNVLRTWPVHDFYVEFGKNIQIASLSSAQVSSLSEVHKTLMISEDLDRYFSTFELRPSVFQTTNNCEEFLVVDLVVTLGGG